MRTTLFFIGMAVVLFFAFSAPRAHAAEAPLDSDFERRIVNLYSDSRCSEIPNILKAKDIARLRPNIIAVIAACKLPGQNSEKLFALAEKEDPEGDLIAMLHALALNAQDPQAAKVYWLKVLTYARSEPMREIARDALSGLPTPKAPLNLSPWLWSARADIGGSYHSAPWFQLLPETTPDSGVAADYMLTGSVQHWIRPGSISLRYRLEGHQFPESQKISTQDQYMDLPLALRVGASEDVVFRPFFDHFTSANKSFDNVLGFGVSGIAYSFDHKQIVSGYAATQDTQHKNVTSTHLAHYHFNYEWEWYPRLWFLEAQFGFDNISASRIHQYRNLIGDFNMSHNDITMSVTARRTFPSFSFGLTANAITRFDNQPSTWTQPDTQQPVTDTRYDYTLAFEPHVLFRLLPELLMRIYTRRTWVWSSIGQQETGFNLSHSDTAVGVALSTYWSSY